MRDPGRIDRMVGLLRAHWWANPDQRLGQLVVNLFDRGSSVFYAEDDEAERRLRSAVEGVGKAQEPENPECDQIGCTARAEGLDRYALPTCKEHISRDFSPAGTPQPTKDP